MPHDQRTGMYYEVHGSGAPLILGRLLSHLVKYSIRRIWTVISTGLQIVTACWSSIPRAKAGVRSAS